MSFEQYLETRKLNHIISDLRIIKHYIKNGDTEDAITRIDLLVEDFLEIKMSRKDSDEVVESKEG